MDGFCLVLNALLLFIVPELAGSGSVIKGATCLVLNQPELYFYQILYINAKLKQLSKLPNACCQIKTVEEKLKKLYYQTKLPHKTVKLKLKNKTVE